MNIENLKKVRQAIANENRDVLDHEINNGEINSIMDTMEFCGTPSCIAGHASFLKFKEDCLNYDPKDWEGYNDFDFAKGQEYLDLNDLSSDLFAPTFTFAHWSTKKGSDSFITKQHVLNTLDLLINGETSFAKAWENGRPK